MSSPQIITQEEAKSRGFRRYFTGQPCIRGHVAERLASNRACITCSTRRKLAWAALNREMLAERKRTARAADPERVRNYERNRYQTDPRIKMLAAAKQRAKVKKIPFDITIDDIKIPDACPLLGIPLVIGDGITRDNSPTLDRIMNNAGYVPGNTIIISHIANRCKGTLRSDDLLKLANNLKAIETRTVMPEWLATQRGLV